MERLRASTGPGSGLYKSTDGGATWTELSGHGLPDASRPHRVAVDAEPPSRVYALVDAKDGGGLYRSDDAGATWRRSAATARIWQRGWYFGRIYVDPKDPDTVYVANISVYRSTDGGKTFDPSRARPAGTTTTRSGSIRTTRAAILASDQGRVVSLDGGKTWSSGTTSRPASSTT